ncbi:RNA polymerase subunit sigma [Salinivibrio sp. IB574]|uniref:ECF-type sigma factor n=1 Tax=Salinivibrio sp. IB574 TaxID=1909444 RepID=UPI00098909F3|nr:ECF-type sigma factor [Salinivibrio sp. IB574]OOF21680.1 RNA polymerase subunit sigma [Salinivibrio sp. IB574]
MINKNADFTQLLLQWKQGDRQSESELYHLAYSRLKQLAARESKRSSENFGVENTIISDAIHSDTMLVNEAYIKMTQADLADVNNRKSFYLMAAKIIRQVLIEQARKLHASKRKSTRIFVDKNQLSGLDRMLVFDMELEKFGHRYPRQADVLKMKYLVGMKVDEISQTLSCSKSLIEKDLKFSKGWFASRMRAQ